MQRRQHHSLQTTLLRTLSCTTILASAALVPVMLPSAASALTVAQTSSSNNGSIRGQSFTPNNIGPNGSGIPPGSGTVLLNSVTFGYESGGSRSATSLYIYRADSLPTSAELSSGTNALFSSINSFTNSVGNDPAFGLPTRTFNFTGALLDVNTTYVALTPIDQSIRISVSSPSSYAGGDMFFSSNQANNLADAAFRADLTATPVPFAFNPLLGLGGAGLIKVGRSLKNRLRQNA